MPEGEAKLPPVVAALPAALREPTSVLFFHHELTTPDVLPPDLAGPKGLALAAGQPAAFARYAEGGKPSHWALVAEYPTPADAAAAARRCSALHAAAKVAAKAGDVAILELAPNALAAFIQAGRRVGVVLKAQGIEAAKKAVTDLSQSLAH